MMSAGGLNAALYTASTWIIPVILAVTLHEASHGFVALQFGDDTALRMGRVTFNPLKHVDPMGTIILPLLLLTTSGFLFGYAKPVPVNFFQLRPARLGMVLVALAGPLTNIALAILCCLLFALGKEAGLFTGPLGSLPFLLVRGTAGMPPSPASWLAANLANGLLINILLCVFNLLPLPPLDGGRVAVGVLPNVLARPLARLEPYGMIILMSLFVISYVGIRAGLGFSLLGWLIGVPSELLLRFLLAITGQG
jgi:Zn-dependent protease